MTPVQLAAIIRYHLGELSSRNAHHEFEHLSRYLARARVYSNILSATGPVGAGGDQGRDFETFESNLTLPAISTFKDRVSEGIVAFACSLKSDIEPKIREDVRSILAGGPVDEIIYFCESKVPVARRHKLQAWAKSEHQLKLQIFDGVAIAEMLADRDVFWIAQEFLHLPAELMPPAPERSDWYAEHLERWLNRTPKKFSNSDFVEVKWGVRHATVDEEARPRLPFWIGLMERFIDPTAPRTLQRSAIYEVAVANLRGKGDMTSQLPRIRDYFADAGEWLAVADLKNAATLMSYSFGGMALNQFTVDPAELFGWRRELQSELDRQVEAATGPGRRSGLLDVRGHLQNVPEGPGLPPPLDRGFDDWERMLDEAEQTPLFPIEEFVDFLSKLTPMFGRHPRFAPLADRADTLLGKRKGPAVAAEKTFERAMAFYERDELLEAIRDLHRVLLKWFTGDTMANSQRAMFLLANCYLELGFAYAAKNVAMAGAFVAKHSDDPEVAHTLPRLLFAAADADDGAGNSLAYLHMLALAVEAHFQLDPDPLTEKHPVLQTNLRQMAALRGLAMRSDAEHLAAVDEVLAPWPKPLREAVLKASADPEGFWHQGSWDDVWTTLEESFLERPFGDLGARREVHWRAFGIDWTATFDNDHYTTGIAEEFLAELQASLISVADKDLCLLARTVDLVLSVSPEARRPKIVRFEERADPTRSWFAIELAGKPREFKPTGRASETLPIVAEVLGRVSALQSKDFFETIKYGLLDAASRVQIARPYRELYADISYADWFERPRRGSCTPFQANRRFHNHESPLLPRKMGPGPNYSHTEALKNIGIRYEKLPKCIGFTVRKLMADPGRRAFLGSWRAEGMCDWEILTIIANTANNIRHPLSDREEALEEEVARQRAAFDVVESQETALAPDLFTDLLLNTNRRVYQAIYLHSWKLDLPSAVGDEKTLEAFLIDRYGLRADDIEHEDIFGWEAP